MSEPVQGFTFDTHAEGEVAENYNGNVCKIIRRAEGTESSEREILEYGPAFWVRFGDDHEMVAHASELSPWYPT